MLVNVYLSKTDRAHVFGDIPHGEPIQAYIVHCDKQGIGMDETVWDRPSNTLGLVLASGEIEHSAQSGFPRSR